MALKAIQEYDDLAGQQTSLWLENLWVIDNIHVIMFNSVMLLQSLSLQEDL
jgi:hypothetical protein